MLYNAVMQWSGPYVRAIHFLEGGFKIANRLSHCGCYVKIIVAITYRCYIKVPLRRDFISCSNV